MHDIHLFRPDDIGQPPNVAHQRYGILAGQWQADELAAETFQLRLQTPALAGDQRPSARGDDGFGDLERGALGTAGREFGNDLENYHAGEVRPAKRQMTSCSTARVRRQTLAAWRGTGDWLNAFVTQRAMDGPACCA